LLKVVTTHGFSRILLRISHTSYTRTHMTTQVENTTFSANCYVSPEAEGKKK